MIADGTLGREAAPRRDDDGHVHHFNRWFWGLVLAAFALRVGYLILMRGRPVRVDGWGYLMVSRAVADGEGFVDPFTLEPSARRPPGWISLLAVARWAGVDALFALQITAAVVGTAAVALIGIAARRITTPRGALVATGLAAVYPGFWFFERELLGEPLAILQVALIVWVVYRFLDRPSVAWAAALGGACGLLALTRAEQLLLTVVLIVPLILGCRSLGLRSRLVTLAVAAGATVLVIAPWVTYNVGRFEERVYLGTGMGTAMAQGACPIVFGGSLLGFHDLRCDVRARATLGPGELDESQVDVGEREFAIDYTRDNLDRLPVVLAARQGRTFGFYRPFQTADIEADFAGAPVGVLHAGTLMYWAMLLPAALGVRTLWPRWRRLLPLLAPFVVVAITVSLTFGQPRYRAPADVGLVLLAAVGIEAWTRRRQGAATGSIGAPGA